MVKLKCIFIKIMRTNNFFVSFIIWFMLNNIDWRTLKKKHFSKEKCIRFIVVLLQFNWITDKLFWKINEINWAGGLAVNQTDSIYEADISYLSVFLYQYNKQYAKFVIR